MVNVLFLFPRSADPKMLDDLISNALIPRLKTAKGLLALTMSDGQIMGRSAPPYSRIVEASFDTLENMMATAPADGTPEKDQFEDLGGLFFSYAVQDLL